jgi:hypothetical protein
MKRYCLIFFCALFPLVFFKTPQRICGIIAKKTTYVAAASVFETFSICSWVAGKSFAFFPQKSHELTLLSELSDSLAKRLFAQALKKQELYSPFHSWNENRSRLEKIPAASIAEQELLLFLEKHWLTKSNGFFPLAVNWIYPCFGMKMQVEPTTTSCYSRNPSLEPSQAYLEQENLWKKELPQPWHFPLILTRPFNLEHYFPKFLAIRSFEDLDNLSLPENSKEMTVLDFTDILKNDLNPTTWEKTWSLVRTQLRKLDLKNVVCIQRVQKKDLGGMRILPLGSAKNEAEERYLLEWLGTFGLSATRLELNRLNLSTYRPEEDIKHEAPFLDKKSCEAQIHQLEKDFDSLSSDKSILMAGTLKLLKGLFSSISEEKWSTCSFVQASVVHFSFLGILEELTQLKKLKNSSLFTFASHIEQIHAHLSALLEIFSPYSPHQFSSIYEKTLSCIPKTLKSLTQYAVHSSGMASYLGIYKAVEKSLERIPHALYGENTYFECAASAKRISHAKSLRDAQEQDWENVDLIVAQFNPILCREKHVVEYGEENVEYFLRKAFSVNQNKRLTLALDCTIDFIDSKKVENLLQAFQKEIEQGKLNIIGFRSGLKYDLFGLDHYCGAPLFMIHNNDSYWFPFEALITDPVLLTDRLSHQWFCLAYESAPKELDAYRRQIFQNTRSLLTKISPLLHDGQNGYQVIPIRENVEASFVDVRVSGPLHKLRAAAIVGGILHLLPMNAGQPIFTRPSFGFYHPNFSMIFGEENSTVRLTVGLDPEQINILASCFERISKL